MAARRRLHQHLVADGLYHFFRGSGGMRRKSANTCDGAVEADAVPYQYLQARLQDGVDVPILLYLPYFRATMSSIPDGRLPGRGISGHQFVMCQRKGGGPACPQSRRLTSSVVFFLPDCAVWV
jgi:hypothetical protein